MTVARASILAAALVLVGAGPAWADDADALIARGLDLREAGKDEEALAVFRQALAASPSSPRARAQVALAEQALGMWVTAESDLDTALAATGDPWIAKNRAPLEGALAVIRRHLGSLEVRGADGAEVAIDGVRLGTLPAKPFRVEAGRRTLEVQAKGFHPTSRAVEIPAGGVARETVTLVALPAGSSSSAPVVSGGDARTTPSGSDGSTQRLLGWVTFGTGAALVATGTASILIRQSIVDDYNTRCPGLGAAQPADCDQKIDSARTWLTVSIVSFVAGGVLTAGGLVLVLTAPHGAQRTARTWCAPGALAVTCGATF